MAHCAAEAVTKGATSPTEPSSRVSNLPDDVLHNVFSYLTGPELAFSLSVCHQFSAVGSSPNIWKLFHRRRLGSSLTFSQQLETAWKHIVPDISTSPQYGAATSTVWSLGADHGPDTWGVPTPPPFPDFGQTGCPLPNGTDNANGRTTLEPIPTPTTTTDHGSYHPIGISTGGYHTAIRFADGSVRTFGSNAFGQLGTGTRISERLPRKIEGFGSAGTNNRKVTKVVCGYAFTMFLTESGVLYGCGFNQNGRVGVSDNHNLCCADMRTVDGDRLVLTPMEVEATRGVRVVDVACGSAHCVVLLGSGEIRTWGRNCSGQLGRGDRLDEAGGEFTIRVEHCSHQWEAGVVVVPPVALVSCSSYCTAVVTREGQVYQWGRSNNMGVQSRPLLIPIRGLEDGDNIVDIKAGEITTVLLTDSGKIFVHNHNRFTPYPRFSGPDCIRRVAVSNSSIICITEEGKGLVTFILPRDWVPHERAPIVEMDAVGMAIVDDINGRKFVFGQAEGTHFVDVAMGSEHCIFLAVTSRAMLETTNHRTISV